jgi:hypothetical protein
VCTPQLRGVVDVAVVKDQICRVVGEIKSGQASPFTQILAGMQAMETKCGTWPYGERFGIVGECYMNVSPMQVLLSTTGV